MFSSKDHKIDLLPPPRSLAELDADSSDETDELMDPISLRLMVVPLKPSENSLLQAVELGSLVEHLQRRGGRSCSHPINPKLRLTDERLKNYVVDRAIIKRRNAYLWSQGYSLDEFLAYRGMTRAEYQRLINLFHRNWLLPAADLGLLGLVSAAGIGAYLYGGGSQSLFFSTAPCNAELLDSYRKLQGVASTISVLTSLGAHLAWNKSKNACETVGITGAAFFMLIILLMSEVVVLTRHEELQKEHLVQHEEPAWVCSRIMAKLSIPFVQGGCLALGKSFLGRFSLFSREKELINNYTRREPLELEAEMESVFEPA